MMRNPTVPDAMAEAFAGARCDFADRLLAVLDAAEAAGGDIRGQQSAALLVSSTASDGSGVGGHRAPPARGGPRRNHSSSCAGCCVCTARTELWRRGLEHMASG